MPLWVKIALSVFAMEILGGLGAFITRNEIADWYATLNQPPGTPPNWLFGPVWTALYAMMGVSFALLIHLPKETSGRSCAIRWFIFQLLLNLSWTPFFFGLHQLEAALVIIVMLVAAILFVIRALMPLQKAAAVLLFPYLAWVCYATYLNAGYVVLNGS